MKEKKEKSFQKEILKTHEISKETYSRGSTLGCLFQILSEQCRMLHFCSVLTFKFSIYYLHTFLISMDFRLCNSNTRELKVVKSTFLFFWNSPNASHTNFLSTIYFNHYILKRITFKDQYFLKRTLMSYYISK